MRNDVTSKLATKSGRALIADDDPIMRKLMRARLALIVDDVVEAADGFEAWRYLTTETFSFAIVDLNMPNINGVTLIQCVRGHPATRHMPIVVVTSSSDRASIDSAMAAGASAFLTKPLSWNVFTAHIEHLMRLCAAAEKAWHETMKHRSLLDVQQRLSREIALVASRCLAAPAGDVQTLALSALLDLQDYLRAEDILGPASHDLDDIQMRAIARAGAVLEHHAARVEIDGAAGLEFVCAQATAQEALSRLVAAVATRCEPGTTLKITNALDDAGLHVTVSGGARSGPSAASTGLAAAIADAVRARTGDHTLHGAQLLFEALECSLVFDAASQDATTATVSIPLRRLRASKSRQARAREAQVA